MTMCLQKIIIKDKGEDGDKESKERKRLKVK